MPSPALPNNTYRYIQVEETNAKWSFSESLLQGLGGDLNYINAQLVSIQNQLTAFYSDNGLSIGSVFIAEGGGGTHQVSPSGKAIIAAFIFPVFDQAPATQTLCVMPGTQNTYFVSQPGQQGGYSAGPCYITGNTLYVSGWGHEWGGYMIYAS